jgi:glycosyltransferase involved in cell wall biosynthesis
VTIPVKIGSADAEIVVFNKGARDTRFEKLKRSEEAPREFFYGFLDLESAGLSAVMLSSAGAVDGVLGGIADFFERGYIAASNFGVRPLSARLRAADFENTKVVVSYTDGFSLSLGLGFPPGPSRPIMIGGFHGLSDIEGRVRGWTRPLAGRLIRRALHSLDHVFCFGDADRQYAIERYGLAEERSSVVPFGVDTEFWRPLPDERQENFVIAVGQDPNRDYDLLASAPGAHPTVIITRRPVKTPPGATHVIVTAGDYFGSDSISDEELRRLYNRARAVIVPLKDVYQPTGYSVTLQAMSCGRPVVLSNIRGLWPHMADGVNCVLVPPGDAAALGVAIARVCADRDFAGTIGRAARETVLRHYPPARNGAGAVALARHGLALWHARRSGQGDRLSPFGVRLGD